MRWQKIVKIVFKKCGWAKKIKHEALGCRVRKKSAVKFMCSPVVLIIVCPFNGCCVVVIRLPPNVLGLGDGGDFLALNFIRRTELPPCTNVSAKHETPRYCKTLVSGCPNLSAKPCFYKFAEKFVHGDFILLLL